MDTGLADAREVEIQTLGKGRLKLGRRQLDLWVDGAHFGQSPVPERVEVVRPGVRALVRLQLVQRHVEH